VSGEALSSPDTVGQAMTTERPTKTPAKTSSAWRPWFALFILVAVIVTGAVALWYYVWGGVCSDCDGYYHPPQILLRNNGCAGTNCTGTVQMVDRLLPLNHFRTVVLNGTGIAIPLTELRSGTVGSGEGLTLTWTDFRGDDELSVGDRFSLSGVAQGFHYQVSFVDRVSGNLIAALTFDA